MHLLRRAAGLETATLGAASPPAGTEPPGSGELVAAVRGLPPEVPAAWSPPHADRNIVDDGDRTRTRRGSSSEAFRGDTENGVGGQSGGGGDCSNTATATVENVPAGDQHDGDSTPTAHEETTPDGALTLVISSQEAVKTDDEEVGTISNAKKSGGGLPNAFGVAGLKKGGKSNMASVAARARREEERQRAELYETFPMAAEWGGLTLATLLENGLLDKRGKIGVISAEATASAVLRNTLEVIRHTQ